jgi:hypothetical protein
MRPLGGFVCAAAGAITGRPQATHPSIHDSPPQLRVLQFASSNLLSRSILRGQLRRSNRTSAINTGGAELDPYRTLTEDDDVTIENFQLLANGGGGTQGHLIVNKELVMTNHVLSATHSRLEVAKLTIPHSDMIAADYQEMR